MSKSDEGALILKLYELRREPKMREARDWFFRDFYPAKGADYIAALSSEHSGHLRMVVSYWEMAAALVKHGAISADLFDDTNGEHMAVFAKIEPLLADVRGIYGSQFLESLETVIYESKNGRERLAMTQERMKGMRAQAANK